MLNAIRKPDCGSDKKKKRKKNYWWVVFLDNKNYEEPEAWSTKLNFKTSLVLKYFLAMDYLNVVLTCQNWKQK